MRHLTNSASRFPTTIAQVLQTCTRTQHRGCFCYFLIFVPEPQAFESGSCRQRRAPRRASSHRPDSCPGRKPLERDKKRGDHRHAPMTSHAVAQHCERVITTFLGRHANRNRRRKNPEKTAPGVFRWKIPGHCKGRTLTRQKQPPIAASFPLGKLAGKKKKQEKTKLGIMWDLVESQETNDGVHVLG